MNNLRKEYFQKYYQENKEKILKKTKKYYREHKELYSAYHKEYDRQNIDKRRVYQREYDRKTQRKKLKYQTGMCKTMINTIATNREYISQNGHGIIKQDKAKQYFYYIIKNGKMSYVSDKFGNIQDCVIDLFIALDDK